MTVRTFPLFTLMSFLVLGLVGVFGFSATVIAADTTLQDELNRAQGTVDARTSSSQEADALLAESNVGIGAQGFFGINPRTATAAQYINTIFRWAGGFIIFMAVAMVTWGGFGYVFSAGKESTIKRSKEMIFGALLAVVLLILTYAILLLVDPRLVQLRQDFGAGDIDAASFVTNTTPISCETNEECVEAAKNVKGLYEKCNVLDDDEVQFSLSLECDTNKKQCVISNNGIAAVFSDLGCTNQDWIAPSAFTCKDGSRSVPVDEDGDILGSTTVLSANTVVTYGAFYEEFMKISHLVPGGLVENLNSLEVVQRAVGALGALIGDPLKLSNEYVYNACKPATIGQRIEDARQAGQSVSSVSCPASAEGDIISISGFSRPSCSIDEGIQFSRSYPDRLVYTCENQKAYLREGSICHVDAAELCGPSPTQPAKRLWASDPCEPGTTCLALEGVPRVYECREPGDASGVSPYGDAITRGGIPGSACSNDAECKNFDQPVATCDGSELEFSDKGVNLTCQQGLCKASEGSVCRQDAISCGSSSGRIGVGGFSYASSCAQGTQCVDPNGRGTYYCE